jgi:hypothetical protein
MEAMLDKRDAYKFLKGLEAELTRKLPEPDVMRTEVRQIVAASKSDDKALHMRQREDAFLHHFAFPVLFEYMQTIPGIDQTAARESLLSEYYRNMKGMCSGTPARKQRHPFNKIIGSKPATIMAQWKGQSESNPLKQSCPDFALRSPFPFKIVFEGKYFEKGGSTKAETELVTNIYQAFFYRALPKIDPDAKTPAWDYDYSCLFAYDASPEGSLYEAWNNLDKTVKAGFWEGANLYVMIIRAKPKPSSELLA